MLFSPTTSLAAAVFLFASAGPVLALQLWKTPGDIPSTVPPPCRIALIGDIKCGPRLIRSSEIQAPGALDQEFLTEYCKKECTESLDVSHTNRFYALLIINHQY